MEILINFQGNMNFDWWYHITLEMSGQNTWKWLKMHMSCENSGKNACKLPRGALRCSLFTFQTPCHRVQCLPSIFSRHDCGIYTYLLCMLLQKRTTLHNYILRQLTKVNLALLTASQVAWRCRIGLRTWEPRPRKPAVKAAATVTWSHGTKRYKTPG